MSSSLRELALGKIVQHLDFLGDIGDTDAATTSQIISHCNVEQLRFIEDSTYDAGRDISDITNPFWKKFYEREFRREFQSRPVQASEGSPTDWRELYEVDQSSFVVFAWYCEDFLFVRSIRTRRVSAPGLRR